MSSPPDVEVIARRFIQAWNAGQRHIVDELAAPDLVVSYTHYPQPYHGPDAFKEMLAMCSFKRSFWDGSLPSFQFPAFGKLACKTDQLKLHKTHHFFPDLSIEVRDIVAEAPKAVVRWTYRGTFQNGEMFGVAAAGQSVEVPGMTIYEIDDGAVQREEGMVDNLALMHQLGLSPGRPDSK